MRPYSANGLTSGRQGGDSSISPASDIYSLGATLYEILVGSPPFNGADSDVREKIRLGRYATPRSA